MRPAILLLLVLGIGSCTDRNGPSGYLTMSEDALVSSHDLRFSLARPEGFRAAPPVTHFPTFHDHPFQVSLGGFVTETEAVFVHAEHVLDGAGILDYSDLERTHLSGIECGTRTLCADLTREEIDGEHDLLFLERHGFTLLPSVYLKQFLVNTDDHLTEYIVSYARTVTSCGEVETDSVFARMVAERIEALVDLERLD